MISAKTVRNQFIDFFKQKDHQFIRSSPVLPIDDPTLLFTNAGMNQFKPIFLNKESPKFSRAANSQKCIRVSGKHNDLEEVGVDEYHHTFFEMLGNWSFGDYYKPEAIKWAWELLTEVWSLDKNRLWVTIYKDDNETGELWKKYTDIQSDRILKFGNKDNFWEMGDTGPCGPCTEIHYYLGPVEKQNAMGVNKNPEYREIWNLVFIQFNRLKNGRLEDLPRKHVDTGLGLERIVSILNNKTSNYDTDLFIPIINKIEEISNQPYAFEGGVPHRVIADHLRMIAFSIADGVMPSNEGRGYVVRRVLRRATRYGRMLKIYKPFLFNLIDTLDDIMSESFPEIVDKKHHVKNIIKSEEEAFNSTLDKGIEIFEELVKSSNSKKILSGIDVFKLYDTYGFPLDLTQLMAKEKGFEVDIVEFDTLMEKQKERARSKNKFKSEIVDTEWTIYSKTNETKFDGYEKISTKSKISQCRDLGENVELVLQETVFYPEGGGQVGDRGIIKGENFKFKVQDTYKYDNIICHKGKIVQGKIDKNLNVLAEVDGLFRDKVKANHTATHLLHQSLKNVLGNHVQQAGSYVGADKLRFDLTHYEALSKNQIELVEQLVNNQIVGNIKVKPSIEDYNKAKKEGAVALFGEKYGDEVRVINISGFSKELCGGTHVESTGEIGLFKIISESSLSRGVRRIEAITGFRIIEELNKSKNLLNSLSSILKCNNPELENKVNNLVMENKKIHKKERKFNDKLNIDQIINKAQKLNASIMLISEIINYNGDLRLLGDLFRNRLKESSIIVIGTIINKKPNLMCAVTDDLICKVSASDIIKKIAPIIDGSGGGKNHLAMAGGKSANKLNDVIKEAKDIIGKMI